MSKRQAVLEFLAKDASKQFTTQQIAEATGFDKADVATICSQLRGAGKVIAHDVADAESGRSSKAYSLGDGSAAISKRPRKTKAKTPRKPAGKRGRKKQARRGKRADATPAPRAVRQQQDADGYRIAIFHDGGVLQQKPGQPDFLLTPDEASTMAGFVHQYFNAP